jgi:catechol 2,3-dioxygenase-like lactoylglutathione lyase family enzyme
MTEWFARPVLNVSSVAASLRFYVDLLGFTSSWQYEEQGRVRVAQVDRTGCAPILAEQWPEKAGKGLMLEGRGVSVKDGRSGYRLLVVEDLDGNQLFFNYPNEPA